MELLAQTTALAGDSGWLGAGLLGLVLGWLLFFHLPAKDKQIEDLLKVKDAQLEKKDALILEQAKSSREAIEAIVAAFKAETESCRRDRESDRNAFLAALDAQQSSTARRTD